MQVEIIHIPKRRCKYFTVPDDNMNDGTRTSYHKGDKIFCKEILHSAWKDEIRIGNVYLLVLPSFIKIGQIAELDFEVGKVYCQSVNPNYPDYTFKLDDVVKIYSIMKIMDRKKN